MISIDVFVYKHVPATFSVFSNIPEHEDPEFEKSNGDPQELVDRMVEIHHQRAASEIMEVKHQVVLEALRSRLDEIEVGYDSADEEELEKLLELRKGLLNIGY